MNKKTQQNLIGIIIFIFAILFMYYKYLYSPLQKRYLENINRLHQMEIKLSELKQRALELPRLQAEMTFLEEEVKDIEKRLPKEKDIPELLRMVTKTAQRYQLKISNFTPAPIISQTNYNEIPFQITVQGTYHGLGKFLTEIGQQQRILNIKNVVMNALQPTKENPSTALINFVLVAYTFKN